VTQPPRPPSLAEILDQRKWAKSGALAVAIILAQKPTEERRQLKAVERELIRATREGRWRPLPRS
jgi:hypothetical protein